MPTVLNYTPGQQVTVFQEVKDGYGQRTDDGYVPSVDRIFYPPNFFEQAPGYPQLMTRLDTGLYYFQFTLPTGAAAVGSYLVDIIYLSQVTGLLDFNTYQIVVTAPFGNYGVTVGVGTQ
ncbi:MAG: hypothetical protein ACREBJ_00115 [Nitrosotalea sp.]